MRLRGARPRHAVAHDLLRRFQSEQADPVPARTAAGRVSKSSPSEGQRRRREGILLKALAGYEAFAGRAFRRLRTRFAGRRSPEFPGWHREIPGRAVGNRPSQQSCAGYARQITDLPSLVGTADLSAALLLLPCDQRESSYLSTRTNSLAGRPKGADGLTFA